MLPPTEKPHNLNHSTQGSARWQCIIIKHFAKKNPRLLSGQTLGTTTQQQQEPLGEGKPGKRTQFDARRHKSSRSCLWKKGVEHVNFSILSQNWPCFVTATIPHTGYIGLRPGPFCQPRGRDGLQSGAQPGRGGTLRTTKKTLAKASEQ